MKKLLFTVFMCISSAIALACTPGVAGSGPSGDPNCMAPILSNDPYSQYNSQTAPPPQKIINTTIVHVPSKYGAMAINKKTGIAGGAIEMNSKAEAKREAIKKCENDGKNAPCSLLIWVQNSCMAGAVNAKNQLFMEGGKPGEVEQIAINSCKAAGNSRCKIFIPEACSVPEGMYN